MSFRECSKFDITVADNVIFREVPIPEHIDIFHLTREMPASDKSALQCVMEVDEERTRLEKLADTLIACEDDGTTTFPTVPDLE